MRPYPEFPADQKPVWKKLWFMQYIFNNFMVEVFCQNYYNNIVIEIIM